MLASGIRAYVFNIGMDQIDIVRLHAAAPRMPRLLAAGCAAAV